MQFLECIVLVCDKMFTSKTVLCILFVIFIFTQINSQMISSALSKARRTQSMKPLSYERYTPGQSNEPSSTLTLPRQSTNQKTSLSTADASAIMREETAERRISSASVDESAIMKEETADTDRLSNINLNEGVRNSEINEPIILNEEVLGRIRIAIRKQLFEAAVGAAITTAIATGGIQLLENELAKPQTSSTTTTTMPTTTPDLRNDPDGIINNMGN